MVKVLIYIEMLFIFSIPVLIRSLWQLKTVVFQHWCLIYALLLSKTFQIWTNLLILKYFCKFLHICEIPILSIKYHLASFRSLSSMKNEQILCQILLKPLKNFMGQKLMIYKVPNFEIKLILFLFVQLNTICLCSSAISLFLSKKV